jgi:hypothetical protein
MTKTTRRAVALRITFYVTAIAFILAVIEFQKYVTARLFEPAVATASLSPLQERTLEAFLDMNHLVTTLDTALLGAIGFLLFSWKKPKRASSSLWIAFASAVSAFLSLFFGYVVYLALLWMLQSQLPFSLDYLAILWARQAQFYAFLLGVVLYADFAFHSLQKEFQDEHPPNPARA